MEWVYQEINGKPNYNKQVDTVGNVLQVNGGIEPKACQKCKSEFKSPIVETPLEQNVPSYNCEECEFKNSGASEALDHKLETSHKIKKGLTKRIVGHERKIDFSKLSHVERTKDDCIILCGDCFGA